MYPQKDAKPSHVDLEADRLTNNEIRAAIRHLRKGVQAWTDVYGEEHWEYPIIEYPDGYYHCYYHPHQEIDLLADASIVSIYSYATNPTPNAPRSAAPAVYGCKFYPTTEPVDIEDDDFVVVTGNSFDDSKYTAVFKGVRNADYPRN